jgi:adenylate cyclase
MGDEIERRFFPKHTTWRSKTYRYGEKKKGTKLSTPEEEHVVPSKEGVSLLEQSEEQILNKIRWEVSLENELILEVDEFISLRQKPSGLIFFEVEFISEAEAEAFVPPEWFGEEITGLYKWSNHSLCINGAPE